MRKRRKVFIFFGVIALLAALFAILRPTGEPIYNGRSLSQWLEIYQGNVYDQTSPRFLEAQIAVSEIGTNALPYLLKWIRYEPSAWRRTLRRRLPNRIADNEAILRWIDGPADRRGRCAMLGFGILGTNATAAIPELTVMMKDKTALRTAGRAIFALGSTGEASIPILTAALADPKQLNRQRVVYGFMFLKDAGYTNICLPPLLDALNDQDFSVRRAATNVLRQIAPEVLGDTPTE